MQALQFLKRFGEAGQGPRGTLGILRALRLALHLRAQSFDSDEFVHDSAIEAASIPATPFSENADAVVECLCLEFAGARVKLHRW